MLNVGCNANSRTPCCCRRSSARRRRFRKSGSQPLATARSLSDRRATTGWRSSPGPHRKSSIAGCRACPEDSPARYLEITLGAITLGQPVSATATRRRSRLPGQARLDGCLVCAGGKPAVGGSGFRAGRGLQRLPPPKRDQAPGVLGASDALVRPETRKPVPAPALAGPDGTPCALCIRPGPPYTFWDYQAGCWPARSRPAHRPRSALTRPGRAPAGGPAGSGGAGCAANRPTMSPWWSRSAISDRLRCVSRRCAMIRRQSRPGRSKKSNFHPFQAVHASNRLECDMRYIAGMGPGHGPAAGCDKPCNATEPRLPHKQVGKASVYSSRFQGRHMADGERFSTRSSAAASKTLPLGTKARVTNLQTGKSARRHHQGIADRCREAVSVDLTPATAKQIGLTSEAGHRARRGGADPAAAQDRDPPATASGSTRLPIPGGAALPGSGRDRYGSPAPGRGSPRRPPFSPGHEVRVRQLPLRLLGLCQEPGVLLAQPRPLGVQIDQALQRQHQRRLLEHQLGRLRAASRLTACRPRTRGPCGRSPRSKPGPAPPSAHARRAAAPAPFARGGTFISARTVRISVMKRTTQSISRLTASSPSPASATGHADAIRLPRSPIAKFGPEGLGDERHDRVEQAQDQAST